MVDLFVFILGGETFCGVVWCVACLVQGLGVLWSGGSGLFCVCFFRAFGARFSEFFFKILYLDLTGSQKQRVKP